MRNTIGLTEKETIKKLNDYINDIGLPEWEMLLDILGEKIRELRCQIDTDKTLTEDEKEGGNSYIDEELCPLYEKLESIFYLYEHLWLHDGEGDVNE